MLTLIIIMLIFVAIAFFVDGYNEAMACIAKVASYATGLMIFISFFCSYLTPQNEYKRIDAIS